MHKKLTAALLAASLSLAGVSLPAFAQEADESTNTARTSASEIKYTPANGQLYKAVVANGYHLYDIYTEDVPIRPHVNDITRLMTSTLLSVPTKNGENPEGKPSLLEHWANVGCGIFAATPSSYASYGDEAGFGDEKSENIFGKRFLHDVSGDGSYGNLPVLLSKVKGSKQRTEGNRDDDCYKDIVTKSTGLGAASNMKEVQEIAFHELRHLNGLNSDENDFRKHNEIQAMTEDKDNNPCLYTMVATKDRQGHQYCYDYNLLGLVFYDFNLHEPKDEQGDFLFSALSGEEQERLNKQIAQGKNIIEEKFSYADSKRADRTVSETVNRSKAPVTADLNLSRSLTATRQTSETKNHNYKVEEKVNFKWSHNIGNVTTPDPEDPLKTKNCHMFSSQTSVSLGIGSEQAWGDSNSITKTDTKTDSDGQKITTTIPAHSVVSLKSSERNTTMQEKYDRPVMISYKVAVFSMNGRYYDDGLAINSFPTIGYQQRSFYTEIGNRNTGTGAWYNLKQRADLEHIADGGKAVTKLIGVKHGYGYVYTWDKPFIDHLDWSEIKRKANNIKLETKGFKVKDSIDYLTTCLPMSVTGGTLTTQIKSRDVEVNEFIPTLPLKTVAVENDCDASADLKPGQSLNLSRIKLIGRDEEGVPFCSFTSSKGSWKLVDENGVPIEKSDLGVLSKNSTGESIFTAAQNTLDGKVYVKYFIDDNYYKYYQSGIAYDYLPRVSSDSVQSQMIEINCKSGESAFEGTIQTPEEIDLPFQPGKPIDLTHLKNLEVYFYDSFNNQLKVKPKWSVKEYNECDLNEDENTLTLVEEGDYHIRAQYGGVYSGWITVHARAEDELPGTDESEPGDDDKKQICFKDAAASLYETVLNDQNSELELPDSFEQAQQSMDPNNSQKAFELAVNQDLFRELDAGKVDAADFVSVKDLALFMYTARDEFELDGEIDTPQGFDERIDVSQVSWRHLPALKWAMANGLDLSDLNRTVTQKEAVQFIQNCIKQIAEEQANSAYLEID